MTSPSEEHEADRKLRSAALMADTMTFFSCTAVMYAVALLFGPWAVALVNFLWAFVGVVLFVWIFELLEHATTVPIVGVLLYLFVGTHLGIEPLLFVNSVLGVFGILTATTTLVVYLACHRDANE
jgi:hypothetical protein